MKTFLLAALVSESSAGKLPCSGERKSSRALTTNHHPNACCGPSPYDKLTKGCCSVANRDIPVVFNKAIQDCCGEHIIDLASQGCCKGVSHDLESSDCCEDGIKDAREFPGCRCEFTEWTEWSSCDATLGGGFQERIRKWRVKDGQRGTLCPTIPNKIPLVERRDGTPDWYEGGPGQSCLQNSAFSLSNGLKNAGMYKDLIVLLDESTSIKGTNFEYAKELVANIVKSLCGGVGKYSNRVSVVRFSADVKIDIDFDEEMTTEDVVEKVKSFVYDPLENEDFKGSTYTASAMKEVYEKIISKTNGWRDGVGPPVCSGVIIDGTCYWIPSEYATPEQMDDVCAAYPGARAAVLDTNDSYEMVRRLVEAEYGFPENDREREGPWAGMTVENGRWSYNENGDTVYAALVDGSQPEGCIQFAFNQDNGNEYKLRSSDCSHTRRVVCEQSPLQHLDVETELLLITDGRSNDPKHFASLERMKALYSATGINVSAIGVGRINEDEIRDLTDNTLSSSEKEGNIFYLMSWESVQKFNKIFDKIHKKFENDACLPLNYNRDDNAWLKWSKTMAKHGVQVDKDPASDAMDFIY